MVVSYREPPLMSRLFYAWLLLPCLTLAVLPRACMAEEAGGAESEAVQMVLEFLRDSDREIRGLALEQVRSELKGEAFTRRFAEELPRLAPEAQIGLLGALANRGDKAARPAILSLLASDKTPDVRAAAIRALAFLGEADDASVILPSLRSESEAERTAAGFALTRLPGDQVGNMILSAVDTAAADQIPELIGLLVERRASNAVPRLLTLAAGQDAVRRTAALSALGELAGPEHLPSMLRIVLGLTGRDRETAEKAVMFLCARIPEPSRDAALSQAVDEFSESNQRVLLPTLGRVGEKTALAKIEAALRSQDSAWHEAGIRAIANWPDGSVADRLIDLAERDPHAAHRTTCLRALIRVAPLAADRDNAGKLELVKTAMKLCTRDEERLLILQRAQAIRDVATLRYLVTFLDQPAYAQEACGSIVELAHHRELREANKSEFDKALDAVIRISKDPVVVDRANRYKKGQTWVRPKASP
ncbi:MAG: hypothetical protein Kow0040_04310 [Thermogutta sp.]